MRIRVFLILTAAIGFVFNSCKKDIEIPAYIHITAATFSAKSGEGTNQQAINHVGIYINDNLEGIYEVPVTFPILRKGQYTVELRPFIKQFARGGLVNYSVASSYTQTVNLIEAKVDTIKPVFGYQSNAKFAWLDDFNNNTKTIHTISGTLDTILVTKSKGAGVDSSLYAYINMGNAVDPFFEIETEDQYVLPLDRRDVYMEMHYKSNIAFRIGLEEVSVKNGTEIFLPSVDPNPTNGEWKKAYIYLNTELLYAPSDAKYKVRFRASNGDNSIVPEIFFDNFKIIYRE